MLPTEFINKNKPTGQSSKNGATARSSSRMTSDDRFKAFMDARFNAPAPTQRRWGGMLEDFGGGYSQQPMRHTLVEQQPEVALPLIRKEWDVSQYRKPAATNPFGEPAGKTDPRDDTRLPAIAPEIRAMAVSASPLPRDIVTKEYIKDIAKTDNDLAGKLADKYLNSYMQDASNGLVPPMKNEDIDELTQISGKDYSAKGALDVAGGLIGGLFKTIDTATRAPVKTGAYASLEQGFRYQEKNIDPSALKPDDLGDVNVANVDLDKLPSYYAGQLKAGFSQNISKQVEESLQASHPDWLSPTNRPDPNPVKDKIYQGIVDKVFQQRQDWDYYTDFATAADGINTLFSAPQMRQAFEAGKPLTKEQNENILMTGNIAGATTFARVTQLVKAIKDAGVVIDPEDRLPMRSGWSAETVNKYAQKLAEKGASLSDIVVDQGMTWPELKRALDLMHWPAENQADIARSLGFQVTDDGDKPIFVTRYAAGENRMVSSTQEEVGKEYRFNIANPDKVISLDDIRARADTAGIDREQFANMLAMKYTYAYLADVKTVPFQDLAASIAFDPTNFGKLQLVWEPVGLLFKGGGKLAKELGKGMYYSGAFMGDVGVGTIKTIGNLIGKAKGLESELIKPDDWYHVSNAAKYLVSETSQSVTNKIVNRAHFVVRSMVQPEYLKDGESILNWVDNVFPKLQDAARTGEWSAFIREVPAGAGDYVASGLNSMGNDLRRIAEDEDAFGHFADAVLKPFSDATKGVDADEVKSLRELVQQGDYAGITRLIADKTVSSRVTDKFGLDEARQSINPSDLFNHATTAYRSGMQVLSDKSLGVWGKEVVSPTAARINDTLSTFARQWTNAVLTARPGWNVINYLDNNARLIANGYNPSADVRDLERKMLELGVPPTQMRQIIYGGNFMDEAVRLNIPVTQEVIDAVEIAKRITVDSDASDLANLAAHAARAADSIKDIPIEARKQMEGVVGKLRVEADKLVKQQGDVKALRDAANKVADIPNQMFGKSATVDTKLFKSNLDLLKEYGNILKSGDGKAISRIWNNWVEVGRAAHGHIEAAARMKVFAPTYIDKYHEALGKLARDLPQLPNEAQVAERFAHIVDPQQKAEAVRETVEAYAQLGQRLNGLVNEAAMKPNALLDIQQYLADLRTNPRSMARNFIYSTQPVMDGMTPSADVLVQKLGDWATDVFDGMSEADMRNPDRVKEAIDALYGRLNTRLRVEGAEANLMARADEIIKPTTKVPDSVVNWAQDGQITNPRDIEVTVKRMAKMRNDVEAINQELRDSFMELNHDPYLNALDLAQRQLPDRAHRYNLMRDSFAEKFSGEAKLAGESVQVVNGTLDKTRGVVAVLSDGRVVPADAVQFEDATRGWYFQQYAKWEKAKPSGNSVLLQSGIGDVTGTGAKMRKPSYAATGTPGMVPPDVARSYTRRMEDDVVAKGGVLPTEYVDADGVKHALAYDAPEDFIQRFASGSGLGYYKPQGGGSNLMDGIQRTADNWTHLAKLADANELGDLSEVYINGRRLSELYPSETDLEKIKQRVFSEKSATVQVRYKRNGVDYVLKNDPKRGETLTDVTRRMWREKVEGVHIETRGQWVPVFDPNAAAGSRVTFQKLGRDDALESLRIPVETGTAIPDEMGEQLLKIQDAAEPVEQIGIEVEAALHNLDNLLRAAPEPPPFKPDFTLGGADVMAGSMKRLPEGGYGVEVRFANGRTQTARVSELQPKPVEGPLNANVAGTPEQIAAEAGVKTPEQQATIAALDPAVEFMRRHPLLQSRDDLLGRGELLRQQGVPVTDQQLNDMADILEAVSQTRFKQEPDFLLKRLNLTAIPPTEGVYQRVNLDTPEFKKFFEGSKVVDKSGDPLVLYHGTRADFETFNKGDIGFHFGTADQANSRLEGMRPINFERDAEGNMVKTVSPVQGESAMPVYVSIKHPIELNTDAGDWNNLRVIGHDIALQYETPEMINLGVALQEADDRITKEYAEKLAAAKQDPDTTLWRKVWEESQSAKGAEGRRLLKDAGFDGIRYRNMIEGELAGKPDNYSYIAFDPGQIKSAIANRGSWDVTNPSMLFQKSEEPMKMTRQGWLTDEERQVVYDQAIAEGKEPAEAMARAAEGYPASSGMVGAQGEPLFQAGPEGEVLGAYKSLFGPNGLTGMIHLGPGATTETIGHEVNHFIMALSEMPEQVFKGPEFDVLRKELRADFNVIAEAAGAPVLKYGGRGPKATRQVMYENLWKVDWESTGLDEAGRKTFEDQARAASERSAKMWTTYLETGQAPTKKLQGVFDRFKNWLAGVFQVKQRNGEQVPIEVKKVFDRWLAENPEWKLTRKGKYVLGNKENKAYLDKAMELTKKTDDWNKAIDNLMVAYGDGFSDSPTVEAFHAKAKQLIRSMKEYNTSGAGDVADDFLETEAGNSLAGAVDNINNSLSTIADIESGVWAPKAKKPSLEEVTRALEAGEKVAKPKKAVASEFQKLSAKSDAEQLISDALAEARQYGVALPEDVDPREALKLIESHIDDQIKLFNASGSGSDKLKREVDEFWQAYGEMLQDGKLHPKQFKDGKWVYPEDAGPLTVMGKLHAGQFKPPTTDKVGYLAQEGSTVDDLLAKERGTPASLDELAALNAPDSTYVSPALVEVMKYQAGVKAYVDQWREAMLKAVDGGFLPGNTVRGLDPADAELVQKWLEDKYAQLGRASSQAQKLAEDKTRLVMMDFETTYNLDRLMQQGPALPQWATTKFAGARPLRVGGIVPFFKFPRENIESWINTLGNHPALIHNVQRYQEQANIERKRFNLPEQFLPTWPVQVGDQVVSVSPFAFVSLGQLIRPFSPYVDEDATKVDQAIGVAGQMGLSLGPTLRVALNVLGLSEEEQPIIPQGQALIPPSLYKNVPDNVKRLLGIVSKRDEFYVNRQIVFDALADMSNVTSESARQDILADMSAAIQPGSGANHPRRVAASDHYYTMKFETSNTGYWTGIYPREISPGELDLKQYKTDLAQLRSAMASAGLNPDQVDQIEGYIAGDPRAEANRRLNALYDADPATAISGTTTEAWANSNEIAGQRKEYYDQRALIEADFQQKYGFSGTTLTDADREDYNRQIQALNKKYEDVLAPKQTSRQPWMTDEDYQRGLSSTWLEYLNGTRPQFNQYQTYAEYERAVDKWEKDLPKISQQLWNTIQSPLAELSTRNVSTLPGYLDAVSNKSAMDQFRSKYDTVSESIYGTLRDKYYNGYWDAVTDKVGPERLLADMEYKLAHPVPNGNDIQKWIDAGLYAGRFSQQAVARELKAHPVADIENSLLSGKTLPERQAHEISNLLSLIPPGNAYFDFIESLPKDQQKYLSAYQVDSYTAFQSPDKWRTFYDAIVPRLKAEFKTPSLNTVREWVSAVHENEQMQGQRDQRFPGIKSSLDTYNAIDRGDAVARKQYRQQHPEIGRYYDWLYNEWQGGHPLWQKYYGSEETSKPTSSGGYSRSTSYGGYGGKRYYAGGRGGGKRYSSSYYSTSGASSVLAGQWQGFRDMAGSVLYNALTSHWDNGSALGESESALLQSLFKQYPFGAKDYNDWLENILPKLRSAMIPGESIFSRNKRYDNQQNQPQTSFGYTWFGRGKNAG